MKEEIERALQPLIGEPLSDMRRFVGIQAFEFGIQRPCKNRKGQDITRGTWRLHAGCYWRITGPDGNILSAEDFGPGGSRRDQMAKPFYAQVAAAVLTVAAIESDEYMAIGRGETVDDIVPTGDPLPAGSLVGEERYGNKPGLDTTNTSSKRHLRIASGRRK